MHGCVRTRHCAPFLIWYPDDKAKVWLLKEKVFTSLLCSQLFLQCSFARHLKWTASRQMWHLLPRPQYINQARVADVLLELSGEQHMLFYSSWWEPVSCKLHHQSHHQGDSLYKWGPQWQPGPNTICSHLYLLLSARIMEVDDCHPRYLFFCLISGCGRGGGGMEALGWRNFDLISLSAPPVPH